MDASGSMAFCSPSFLQLQLPEPKIEPFEKLRCASPSPPTLDTLDFLELCNRFAESDSRYRDSSIDSFSDVQDTKFMKAQPPDDPPEEAAILDHTHSSTPEIDFGLTDSSGTASPKTPEPDSTLPPQAPQTKPERPLVPTCPADWEAKKEIIQELYMTQNLILNEVVEIMLTKHKFKAT